MHPGQPTLGHLPQVEQQVPPVRDLHGPRCPEPDAAGVLDRAVTRDGPDPAVAPEPVGQRRGAPVRQQVDHAMPLQVDENGPIGSALAAGPVVDAEHARSRASRQGQAADQAQNCVATRRHADLRQHARARLAAKENTHTTLRRRQPVRALCPWRDQAR